VPDPISIYKIARSPAHPLRAVRRAAREQAKKQIKQLEKLDLADASDHDVDLVDRWIAELRRHAAKSR